MRMKMFIFGMHNLKKSLTNCYIHRMMEKFFIITYYWRKYHLEKTIY